MKHFFFYDSFIPESLVFVLDSSSEISGLKTSSVVDLKTVGES